MGRSLWLVTDTGLLTSFAKTHGRTTLGLVHLVLFGTVAIAGGQPQRDVDREERGDDARDLSAGANPLDCLHRLRTHQEPVTSDRECGCPKLGPWPLTCCFTAGGSPMGFQKSA